MEEFKRLKSESVERMRKDLEHMEPLNLPLWAAAALLVPFFIYQATLLTLRMWWATLKFFFLAPLILGSIWVDLILLLGWYCNEIAKRVGK